MTYCSGKKRQGDLTPDGLYDSTRIDQFTAYCKTFNLNWAILSAKYGLFFPEERKGPYDMTLRSDHRCWLGINVIADGKKFPKGESDAVVKKLTDTVRAQASRRLVEEVVFYTHSLKQPKPYLAVLHFVLDGCHSPHSWRELLECIGHHDRIQVVTRLVYGR